MTNLEFYKDKILENIDKFYPLSCSVCSVMNNFDIENGCSGVRCESTKALNWMLKEHKESIKLKRWEKDLLKSFGDTASHYNFDYVISLSEMKHMGYFEGVKDTSMELGDILGNCEVVE